MNTLILYSTPGCHLCELALDVISPLLDKYDFFLEEVDIADSLELMEHYGVRIPVLKLPKNSYENAELGWPFDSQQADSFLRSASVQP